MSNREFLNESGDVDGQDVEIVWRVPGVSDLHPLLRERLHDLGIADINEVPDLGTWRSLLSWASDQIGHLERDRQRLAGAVEARHELTEALAIERAQWAGLQRELGQAGYVQRLLVPPPKTLEAGGVELTSLYRPASSCGGDWWSVYEIEPHRVMIVIGDVTGHGFAPAMMTGVAKGAADLIVRATPPDQLSPAKMLCELNLSICDAGPESLLMTCAAAEIDTRAGRVVYASAGHAMPYVIREGEPGTRPILSQLVASGVPLGDSRETTYENRSRSLAGGDTVLWYTDGVVDVANDAGELFGEKRLRSVLTKKCGGTTTGFRNLLWSSLFEFMGTRSPEDDITFVVAQLPSPRTDASTNGPPTVTFHGKTPGQ